MTDTDELTLADEVAVVIVRLVCDTAHPFTWRAGSRVFGTSSLFANSPRAQARRVDRHTNVATIMFLEQTILATCGRMQHLGLSPCDVLRHDGGRATACIVDTVRANIGTFPTTTLNVEWQVVLEAAMKLVEDVHAEQRSRKRFDTYSASK